MTDSLPTGERGTIAYISHYFPALTQTFVYREIQALEELGWRVKPFSIRRPTKGISEDARELAERTTYLLPLPPLRFAARVLGLVLRRPVRSAGILARLLLAPGESFRARIHGLTHFFGGLHLAPEVARSGARHIHAHFGMNPATLAMVAAEYLGIPFSMTIHARDLFVDTALLRAKLRRARFTVTISEYNRRILRDLASGPHADRIRVAHCGVDLRKFEPRNGTAPEGSGGPPVFLAVGRLVPKKGYAYLVEAARILEDRKVPFEVRIIGGGPDHAALAESVSRLGLGDRVKLEGSLPQEKLLPILRNADGFVLPCVLAKDGDQDGIPVSLMEAMAYGIPCVSTSISGIPELIESGAEGLLVPEKDPLALADALETLARDRELRHRLGRAARRKVEAAFTLEGLARELDGLYRESLAAR